MSLLISALVTVLVVILILYLINMLPIDGRAKQICRIIIIILRGRSRERTKSSIVFVPINCFSEFSVTNLSTHSVSRFQTATGKPCSSTFSARFRPITARPIIPNCACFALASLDIVSPAPAILDCVYRGRIVYSLCKINIAPQAINLRRTGTYPERIVRFRAPSLRRRLTW